MFLSDELVFAELHKTGCSHIRRVLEHYTDGEAVGKHNTLPTSLIDSDRMKIGSVRNPWDWYVSLWAFGCLGKGQLHHATTSRNFKTLNWKKKPGQAFQYAVNLLRMDVQGWSALYSDVENVENFRKWMKRISDPEAFLDMQEGLAFFPAPQRMGLMTYRFIRLFCCAPDQLLLKEHISFEDIEDACFVDRFIRNENMETDLKSVFETLRRNVSISELQQLGRTNSSVRNKSYVKYYDDCTADLVAKRDSFIVRKFGYSWQVS